MGSTCRLRERPTALQQYMQQEQSALLDEVVMASTFATRPKMAFWSAGRSLVVAPAPVVLATTAAAPATGRQCWHSMSCICTDLTPYMLSAHEARAGHGAFLATAAQQAPPLSDAAEPAVQSSFGTMQGVTANRLVR